MRSSQFCQTASSPNSSMPVSASGTRRRIASSSSVAPPRSATVPLPCSCDQAIRSAGDADRPLAGFAQPGIGGVQVQGVAVLERQRRPLASGLDRDPLEPFGDPVGRHVGCEREIGCRARWPRRPDAPPSRAAGAGSTSSPGAARGRSTPAFPHPSTRRRRPAAARRRATRRSRRPDRAAACRLRRCGGRGSRRVGRARSAPPSGRRGRRGATVA